jgi:hypothetical protein
VDVQKSRVVGARARTATSDGRRVRDGDARRKHSGYALVKTLADYTA